MHDTVYQLSTGIVLANVNSIQLGTTAVALSIAVQGEWSDDPAIKTVYIGTQGYTCYQVDPVHSVFQA